MIHDVIIVGAGLSGLMTAYQLKHKNILILEARDRIGGRIHTIHTSNQTPLELGATWFGPQHTYLVNLLKKLDLPIFPQYQNGISTLVFNSMVAPHEFDTSDQENTSFRLNHGTTALIKALVNPIKEHIRLNTHVDIINDKGDYIELHNNKTTYRAKHVILTLPPQLIAAHLQFHPKLPVDLINKMESTPTWMSHAIKVVISFKAPFWRKSGKSGMVISQIGPVTEIYDHSDMTNKQFALMGFVNQQLRLFSKEERKKQILNYLSTHLGEAIYDYITYQEKDWSLDQYTTVSHSDSTIFHPNPNHGLFENIYMNGKLHFSGTETSMHFPGYMEGAIYNGLQKAKIILNTH